MVTSFQPGDGKSRTSLNLACVYSWTDKKVLLIDGDFRKATLRESFPSAPKEGFLEYLKADDKDIHDFIVKEAAPNLDYLPAGRWDDFVTEILQGEKLENAIKVLKEEYDHVIIDTAPATRVVDTVQLSEVTDGTLIVARSGKTKPEEIQVVQEALSPGKAIGFIVNDLKASEMKYANYANSVYGYGGSASYGYGYTYKSYKAKKY